MSFSMNVHGCRKIRADMWEAHGSTGLDLGFCTEGGSYLTLTLFCRDPAITAAYATAINSVSRGASEHDPELDGVMPLAAAKAA